MSPDNKNINRHEGKPHIKASSLSLSVSLSTRLKSSVTSIILSQDFSLHAFVQPNPLSRQIHEFEIHLREHSHDKSSKTSLGAGLSSFQNILMPSSSLIDHPFPSGEGIFGIVSKHLRQTAT